MTKKIEVSEAETSLVNDIFKGLFCVIVIVSFLLVTGIVAR